jgi:hypothetical protein
VNTSATVSHTVSSMRPSHKFTAEAAPVFPSFTVYFSKRNDDKLLSGIIIKISAMCIKIVYLHVFSMTTRNIIKWNGTE